MAIYRTAKKGNFSQFDNALINNTYMSMKATMLLLKMLSKPSDWKFTVDGIVSICKEGKTAVMSAIAELEKFGHLKRYQVRKPNGQIGFEYDVYESPKSTPSESENKKPAVRKPQAKKQAMESPSRVSPHTENLSAAYYIYNKYKKTKKDNKKICESAISHLNALTGSAYKPTTRATVELIDGLVDDGFTEKEILCVIDKKFAEWNGTEWAWCLRPSTLFGKKFEDYLNAPARTSSQEVGECGIKIHVPETPNPMSKFMSIH